MENHKQLHDAAAEIREGIGRVGDPFEYVLDQLDLPTEIADAGGSACLVEEAATGAQVTVEGYSYRGDVRVYGIVDSVTCPGSSSFLRYQYPSTVPAAVADRLAELSRRVIGRIGLDGTTFDIEYFWDAERDAITLLEVNPRHSQSHAELFEQVDGITHHDVMLQLALGREPRPPHRKGPYAMAAKWFLRRDEDGVAVRVPTAEEIERVERDVPGCTVTSSVQVGDRLSELHDQDSYSYAIANVYVGADSEDELRREVRAGRRGPAVRVRGGLTGAPWTRKCTSSSASRTRSARTRASRSRCRTARAWPAGSGAPRGPTLDPVPAVLEFIPYRQRDLTAVRDSIHHPYFAGHGYGRRAGRPARQRRLRGRAHRRVPGAGAARRRGGARLDRRAAVVQRAHRDDGHLLGRVQRPAGSGPPPAEPARDRHRVAPPTTATPTTCTTWAAAC